MMYEAHLESVLLNNETLTSDDSDTMKVVSHKKKARAAITLLVGKSNDAIKSTTPTVSRSDESDTSTKAISHRSKREEKKALLLQLVDVVVVRIGHRFSFRCDFLLLVVVVAVVLRLVIVVAVSVVVLFIVVVVVVVDLVF